MATDAPPKSAVKRKPKPPADPPSAPLIMDPGVVNPFPVLPPTNGDTPPKPPPAEPGEPGARAPRKRAARKSKVTDAQIRTALCEILTAPGVPMSMFKMDWGAEHVFRTGPEFADAMVAYSLTNQWLREKLEAIARGDNAVGALIAIFGLVTAGAQYLIPLLAYLGVIPLNIGEKVNGAPIPPNPVQHGPQAQAPFPA